MSLEIFIVFHKEINEDNYKELTDAEKTHLTFVAVNEAIPKIYDSSKYRILKEWELPIYHPELQRNGFNENSVMRHLYENKRVMSDYVGITQYDFYFPKNSIQSVIDTIRAPTTTPVRVFFGSELKHYETCFVYTWIHFDTYNARVIFELMKQKYEQLRNRPIDRNKEFPLLNSYIIPTKTFYEIMPHVNDLYKMYMDHQVFGSSAPFKDLAGSFERVMAFMIGQEADTLNHWNIRHTH
jgi:hypothetical protein